MSIKNSNITKYKLEKKSDFYLKIIQEGNLVIIKNFNHLIFKVVSTLARTRVATST